MNDKDVLVLFSYRNHKYGYIEGLFNKLSKHSIDYGLRLNRGSLKDMHISVLNNRLNVVESLTGKNLKKFRVIYFELWYKAQQQALAASLYAMRNHIPFFSRELTTILPITKTGELARLADNNISLPDTFISSNREIKHVFNHKSTRPFGFPIIVKAAYSYGGNDNHLIQSYSELAQLLKNNKNTEYIVQAFIPNNCDYRCLVMGGEIKLILKRTRNPKSDTHLNNTSKGAEGEVVPVHTISKEAQSDVIDAAKILNRAEFAGVDLIVDSNTGVHYILEVNQTPQIEIGAEVDQKVNALLSYIKERANETQ